MKLPGGFAGRWARSEAAWHEREDVLQKTIGQSGHHDRRSGSHRRAPRPARGVSGTDRVNRASVVGIRSQTKQLPRPRWPRPRPLHLRHQRSSPRRATISKIKFLGLTAMVGILQAQAVPSHAGQRRVRRHGRRGTARSLRRAGFDRADALLRSVDQIEGVLADLDRRNLDLRESNFDASERRLFRFDPAGRKTPIATRRPISSAAADSSCTDAAATKSGPALIAENGNLFVVCSPTGRSSRHMRRLVRARRAQSNCRCLRKPRHQLTPIWGPPATAFVALKRERAPMSGRIAAYVPGSHVRRGVVLARTARTGRRGTRKCNIQVRGLHLGPLCFICLQRAGEALGRPRTSPREPARTDGIRQPIQSRTRQPPLPRSIRTPANGTTSTSTRFSAALCRKSLRRRLAPMPVRDCNDQDVMRSARPVAERVRACQRRAGESGSSREGQPGGLLAGYRIP